MLLGSVHHQQQWRAALGPGVEQVEHMGRALALVPSVSSSCGQRVCPGVLHMPVCLCALLPMEVCHQLGFRWPLCKPHPAPGENRQYCPDLEVRQREGARGGVGCIGGKHWAL